MNEVLEVLLTTLLNVSGYAFAALIVVHSVRRRGSFVAGFPAAALALFALWIVAVLFYTATQYLILDDGDTAEAWLETTSSIAENQQSEIFQIWLASLVFKYLPWPGSPESK